MSKDRSGPATGSVRCAIYTRKSTTEGLDSDFSSLDAQREACEHYVRSQAALGWTLVEVRYDDGGFTGGNLERPGLTRLVDDVERGLIDSVVVYKVDRLSRSLIDFARLMERFEKKSVAFVSVTQAIDTSGSMGRLMLNVLLSFAQFERELISERTRDKIQAARRRGKWTGGRVVLGYVVDPERRRLRVDPNEAKVVSLIFELYLKTHSIGEVARRINALGHTQRRCAKGGLKVSAGRWSKNSVHRILRNPTYVGKVRGGDGTLHLGEHEAIVSLDTFERASKGLDDRTTGRTRRSRKAEYLLTGILRCGPCGAAMTSSASTGRGGQRYRYYRCCLEQPEGGACPTGLLNAGEIEQAIVDQVKEVARRDELKRVVLAQMETRDGLLADTQHAHKRLNDQMTALSVEADRLLMGFKEAGAGGRLLAGRLGEIEGEMDQLRLGIADLDARIKATEDIRTRRERVTALLDGFDEIWEALVPEERRELFHLLVCQVVVELDRGGLRIAFHDLAGEAKLAQHEVARATA